MRKKHLLRKLKNNDHGGITVYVLILFGMSIMLYFFGFTSMWSDYQSTANTNYSNITNATYQTQKDSNPLSMMINLLSKNSIVVGIGLSSLVIVGIIGWLAKVDLSAFYTYLIPIGLLAVFLNTIVFPIYPISDELAKYSLAGVPISVFLIAFFNLWFLLAVIEYVRSGVTS